MTIQLTKKEVREKWAKQDLKFFRDRETRDLVRFKRIQGVRYNVMYIASTGHQFCHACANQEDAEPPIVAGQVIGDAPTDTMQQCEGCGFAIYPLQIVPLRGSKNASYVQVRNLAGQEFAILVSYETPVALFYLDRRIGSRTDIAWSRSTEQQISDFEWQMRGVLAERDGLLDSQGRPDRYRIKVERLESIGQEALDDILRTYIGSHRLPDKRDPDLDYSFQSRINTVMDYTQVRADLAAAKVDRLVVKPNRMSRRFRSA